MENRSAGAEDIAPSDNTSTPVPTRPEHQLLVYGLPVVVMVGTLGNVASAIVLSRPKMRTKSVYFYLLLVSVVDTLVLYCSGVKTWLRLVAGIEWLHASNLACRCLTFTFLAALHLSAWLVVLTTTDRFVAVCFPLQTASFCSKTRARLASLILFISTIVFDGHVFWTFELLPEGKSLKRL